MTSIYFDWFLTDPLRIFRNATSLYEIDGLIEFGWYSNQKDLLLFFLLLPYT